MDLLYLIVLFISLFIDGLDTVIMKSVNLKTIIDSSNILFTSDEVSLLACAQRCKFRHKDAAIRFQGQKCVCFTNYDMDDIEDYDDGTVSGIFLDKKMKKMKLAKIDGSWSDWTHWGAWAQSCNDTTRTRNRTCDNPKPVGAGLKCKGNSIEIEKGSLLICPVHGNWGEWSAYSPCSKTCDYGEKSRYHICDNPSPRHNGNECLNQDGNGRSLNETWYWHCRDLICPVNGHWGHWFSWKNYCGKTTQSRHRYCNNPRQAGTGLPCTGSSKQTRPVLLVPCPH